jgi:YcxB-like protein
MTQTEQHETITFSPNMADVLAAQRTHFFVLLTSKRTLRRFFIVGLLLAAMVISILLFTGWEVAPDFSDFTTQAAASILSSIFWRGLAGAFAAWTAVVGIVYTITWFLMPSRARRAFAQQKAFHAEYDLNWDAQTMELKTAKGSYHCPWSDFVRWAESKTTFLIYQSDNVFNFAPKRAFTDRQAEDFRAKLIAANLPKAKFPKA